MSKIINPHENDAGLIKSASNPIHRRSFMKYTGAGVALTTLLLVGCDDDDEDGGGSMTNGVDLGSGDVGVLNYAYALEQLEAAFYAKVISSFYTGATQVEKDMLTAIAKHEAIHRDFFKAAINRDAPGKIIQDLEPDFSTIDFTNKTSVLGAAKAFEDLGVQAYNGAGQLLKTPAYLVIAGQIVSVEARHAAFVRDMIKNGDFASDDIVDPATGLDKALTPVQVAVIANNYLKTKVNANNVGK